MTSITLPEQLHAHAERSYMYEQYYRSTLPAPTHTLWIDYDLSMLFCPCISLC